MSRPVPRIEMMDDEMAEIIRQKTPAERLAIAHGMWRMARDLLRAYIAQQNPTWTPELINREVASRMSHGLIPPVGRVSDPADEPAATIDRSR